MALRQGSIGSLIEIEVTEDGVALDISSATALTLKLTKPNGDAVEWEVDFGDAGGVDGMLAYTTLEGDLDQAGTWTAQPLITLPTGQWPTDPFYFEVGYAL